jgi:hypothetical protein
MAVEQRVLCVILAILLKNICKHQNGNGSLTKRMKQTIYGNGSRTKGIMCYFNHPFEEQLYSLSHKMVLKTFQNMIVAERTVVAVTKSLGSACALMATLEKNVRSLTTAGSMKPR